MFLNKKPTFNPHSSYGQNYVTQSPHLSNTCSAQQTVKQRYPYVNNPIIPASNPVIDQSSFQSSYNFSSLAGMRIPQLPFFSGENQKGDISFEVWKFELNCLIRESVYPESIILQAIRRSLRGKSRDNLLTLGETASSTIILNQLEDIYGICSSNEVLLQEFYLVSQLEKESVAYHSVRIENLLRRATPSRPVDVHVRNEMLCARLWNGLRDPLLKNSCRFMFEYEKDFNKLRKYIRSVEQDLCASAAQSSLPLQLLLLIVGLLIKTKSMAQSADKTTKKFDSVLNQMKQLREQLRSMEKKFAEATLYSNPVDSSSSQSTPSPQLDLPKR